jgi:hypothetical protein
MSNFHLLKEIQDLKDPSLTWSTTKILFPNSTELHRTKNRFKLFIKKKKS